MIHLQNLPRLHNDRDAIRFQRCASHLSLGLLTFACVGRFSREEILATLAC